MPYIISFWLFNNIGEAYRIASGRDMLRKIIETMHMLGTAFSDSIISFNSFDIIVGLIGSGSMFAVIYCKKATAKKFRKDKEYGSARWGKPDDIKPYIDPKFKNNIILTKTEFLTLDSRPTNPKYARNKNVLVIGGSGSGKTRFFVKPNLMQLHSSYVVTDPKGQILVECGKLLKHNKYHIKVLNTINFKKSMHYNPFVYIKSEKDILKLVTALITNTNLLCDKADDEHGGRLPIHVRCLLDEFSNIGQIPQFEKLIATIRSREISACIILQAQSQLKAAYKDNMETIMGNCVRP